MNRRDSLLLVLCMLQKLGERRWVPTFIFCMVLATVIYVASHFNIPLNQYRSNSTVAASKSTPRWRHGYHSNGYVPSILCLVLTSPKSTAKMAAVNQTWGRRCNKTLYVLGSKSNTTNVGDKLFVQIPEDRAHLPGKMKAALEWVYTAYSNGVGEGGTSYDYDWVMKADDDTYMIVENLRLLLSQYSPDDSLFLGSHFKKLVRQGYMSGGAGYVLSSRALRDLVRVAFTNRTCNVSTGDEDVQIGECLMSINATIPSTSGKDRKETFHAEDLGSYLVPPFPKWLKAYMWNEAKFGPECCDRFSISFHHVSPRDMYVYDHLLYGTRVHGNPPSRDIT